MHLSSMFLTLILLVPDQKTVNYNLRCFRYPEVLYNSRLMRDIMSYNVLQRSWKIRLLNILNEHPMGIKSFGKENRVIFIVCQLVEYA